MPRTARDTRLKACVTVLLAFVGGWVDAVGYIVLLHVFTAHMSGNSVAMTVKLAERDWGEMFRRAFPIPLFIVGVALGVLVNELIARRGRRAVFWLPLTLEAVLLLLFAIFGRAVIDGRTLPLDPWWRFYLLAALPPLAMGLQNATIKQVAGRRVRTTYISGVLTNLAEESVRYIFWHRDQSRHATPPQRLAGPRPSLTRVGLLASIWLGYVAGGLLGALAELVWPLWLLAIPVACLLIVAAIDLWRPLANLKSSG
jgi:uncharacterized membrane protein YoaK (UPF0700 family)